MQNTSEVVWLGFAPMEFLGRQWRKPADHEQYLSTVYGDWRTPIPTTRRTIERRRPDSVDRVVRRPRWRRRMKAIALAAGIGGRMGPPTDP
jgi:hypothetical protein